MMIRQFVLVTLMAVSFLSIAHADNLNSPIGKWITIDDKTQERSGIVDIYTRNGKLDGKIVKILPGGDRNPADRCVKCPGNFQNKPLLDLVFLTGFQQKSDGTWEGGQILDPKEGRIYKGTIKLIDNGRKLELRGYWGPFWRTQTWIRK